MKIAIYSRKSVYTGKGESIENQIEMCKQYVFSKIIGAKKEDIFLYEDEGFSAKNIDRPEFKRMLQDIKANHFDYIICYRLDRISRNVSDFATLIEDLNQRSIAFICIKEEFDTSKPMGKAMMYIASVFAQLERETIAERVRDNMLMLARTGRWLGGTSPIGFSSEKSVDFILDGKQKTSCNLKFNSVEIDTVKLIFESFLKFDSISAVSKYLIKNNIKSRHGKFFSPISIKDILTNPVYCIADKDAYNYFSSKNSDVCFGENECSNKFGLISYNKRDYKKMNSPRQEKDQWIIAIGKHSGIVSGKKWVEIQTILEKNTTTSSQPKAHNDYSLLSGLIFCSKCNSRMFAKSRNNSDSMFDYICSNKMRGNVGMCDCQNLNGNKTDSLICAFIKEQLIESTNIFNLLQKVKNDLQCNENSNPLANINLQINICNNDIDNLVNALLKTNVETTIIERINARATQLNEQLKQLTAQKEKLLLQTEVLNEKELNRIATSLSDLKDYFNDLTIQEKRKLIKLIIKKIEWSQKDLHIFM